MDWDIHSFHFRSLHWDPCNWHYPNLSYNCPYLDPAIHDTADARPADNIAFQIPHILYTIIVCHKSSAAAEPALLN